MKIDNSLVLDITGLDPASFRKKRLKETEPRLNVYPSGKNNAYAFDVGELMAWFTIHMPGKAERIREYLRHRIYTS